MSTPKTPRGTSKKGKPSKFTNEELQVRSKRMQEMNRLGICGPKFSRLGGRPRKGETKEQAKARRLKELDKL